jgi:hypothetical protein
MILPETSEFLAKAIEKLVDAGRHATYEAIARSFVARAPVGAGEGEAGTGPSNRGVAH